jgi:alginate O-acetyltransferase complex protein AlgI
MLFNSIEFLFIYLPTVVLVFYVLGARSREVSILWLIFASLAFYAWWRPLNVLIIAPSIVINFILATILLRLSRGTGSRRVSQIVLLLGILFNVSFLGFFKYADFMYGTINDLIGTDLVLRHIILPLGISFITFQKIAFLIDVQAGRIKSFTFRNYCTFVLFFPQLVAGPIVHYREMMPQFDAASGRLEMENVCVGLTLLFFGLFKKVIFADNIALLVTPIYDHSAVGGGPSLLLAWVAAVGFTLQIYFDFSGYSDMALGLARLFGIRLPQNFDSPLRASSVIDFWLRWHMTLTRFLTAYIYNPLTLWLTRRRLGKGKPGLGARNPTTGAFVTLLMFPTIVTMFVSGLWHGAGYGFIVWGLLHGVYLTINHGWRAVATQLWLDKRAYERVMRPAGLILTFVSVSTAMVFFRAPTIRCAIDILKGIFGLNGLALPQAFLDRLGPLTNTLRGFGVTADSAWTDQDFAKTGIWMLVLLFVALACPNTLQILDRYEPAIGVKPRRGQLAIGRLGDAEWGPSVPWAIVVSAIAAVAIGSIGGPGEFLYWHF